MSSERTEDERIIDDFARIVAATARGPRARREALASMSLDERGAEALHDRASEHLRGSRADALRARFKAAYARLSAPTDADPDRTAVPVTAGREGPTLPFAQPAPPATIPRLARYLAELEGLPDREEATHRRFGLGDDRLRAEVLGAWRERLRCDAQASAELEAAKQKHLAEIRASADRSPRTP